MQVKYIFPQYFGQPDENGKDLNTLTGYGEQVHLHKLFNSMVDLDCASILVACSRPEACHLLPVKLPFITAVNWKVLSVEAHMHLAYWFL